MPGDLGELAVNTRVHTCYPMRTRGCGCAWHPAFPTPSVLRANDPCTTRAHRAARSETRASMALAADNVYRHPAAKFGCFFKSAANDRAGHVMRVSRVF